jgi:hypothetical protein
MENENTSAVETEEVEIDDVSFDEGFGIEEAEPEEDMDLSEDSSEETETPEAEEAESEPEKAEEPEPETKPEADNQRFKLKYNGEESEVDRDKIIELAQKGMDYDRIKAERDSFKTDAPTMQRYKEQNDFLEALAKTNGITVEQLIEDTKVRMMMSDDDSLTEDAARKKVRGEKAAEKKEETKAEATPEERRQQMFASFMNAYPDLKAEEIPQEVWEDAGRTFDLTGAYQRYVNRELRKELETLRQNNKNRERSTGSRKSIGASKPKDDFDEAFDSF